MAKKVSLTFLKTIKNTWHLILQTIQYRSQREIVQRQQSKTISTIHLLLPLSKASNRALRNGPVAQLGERLVRNEEVAGPIPVRSTIDVWIGGGHCLCYANANSVSARGREFYDALLGDRNIKTLRHWFSPKCTKWPDTGRLTSRLVSGPAK